MWSSSLSWYLNLPADKNWSHLPLFSVGLFLCLMYKVVFHLDLPCRYMDTIDIPKHASFPTISILWLPGQEADWRTEALSRAHLAIIFNIINLWLSTTRHVHITQHEERLQHSPGSCPPNPSIFIQNHTLPFPGAPTPSWTVAVLYILEDDRGRVECVNTRSDGRAETKPKPKLVTSLKCPRTH